MRRRGFIPIVTAIMALLALGAGIGIIIGVTSGIGQSLLGRIVGAFTSFSLGGSYETTALLDGLPIQTSGKIAIESHMALTPGAYDMNAHYTATNTDTIFAGNAAALKLVKNRTFKAFETSSFIAELNGKLPPEDETWYVNQRWCYVKKCFMGRAMGSKADYLQKRVVVTNPKNGRSVVASVLDWGPAWWTRRVGGISPEVAASLGVKTNDKVNFGWAVDQGVPLGPVKAGTTVPTTNSNSVDPSSGFSRTPKGFPRFLQYRGPWASERYGNCPLTDADGNPEGYYSSAACGPSALANVLKHYQEKGVLRIRTNYPAEYREIIDPYKIGTLAVADGYRVCRQGTNRAFIKGVGEKYFNLKVSNELGVSSWDVVAAALERKVPVIASMGPGVFTSENHFVVLYDIDEAAGKVFSSDSYKRNITEAEISKVRTEANAFFIINTQ